MRRAVAGLALAASLLVGGAGPAHAYHERDRCRYEDCDDGYGRGGDGGDSGGHQGYGGGGGHGGSDYDGDGDGPRCRNFCFYGIPAPGQQPKGFIPPNPGKIPQQIADFVKVVSDFVQAVIKFAV